MTYFWLQLQKPRALHLPPGHTFLFQRNPLQHAVPVPPGCTKEPTDAPRWSQHASVALLLGTARHAGEASPPLPGETNPEGNRSQGSSGTSQPGSSLWAGTASPPLSLTSITEIFFQLAEHHQLPGLFGAAVEQENVARKMVLEERGVKASGRQGWKGACPARCGFGG